MPVRSRSPKHFKWWSRTSFVEVIPLSSLRILQLKLLHPEHLIADGVIISFSNWLSTGTGRRGFSAGRPQWVLVVSKRPWGCRPWQPGPGCVSGRDRSDQRLDPDNVHDPCQIVGQNR